MKIISIVGARPQFVKLSPLYKEIDKRKHISHVIIHTGQHYDYEMSKLFFDELHIPRPDYNLNVGSYNHGKQTALMLERIEKVLLKEKNTDFVLVYGDTNSTLAGALAAVKLHIPVAHVEAGLRSYRLDMPEEINRIVTDSISRIFFCPTRNAVRNLKREGKTNGVYLAGDLMQEILLDNLPLIKRRSILGKLDLNPKEYFLLTVHRQENTDNFQNLKSILLAFAGEKKRVVFPVHPRTKKSFQRIKDISPGVLKNFILIDPVSYLDMLALEKNALKIITDSGGVQKEAHWLKVPCLILRNETEWTETLGKGSNVLVGVDSVKIRKMLNVNQAGKCSSYRIDKGVKSSKRIIDILANHKGAKC